MYLGLESYSNIDMYLFVRVCNLNSGLQGLIKFHCFADMFEQRWGFSFPTMSHSQCMWV